MYGSYSGRQQYKAPPGYDDKRSDTLDFLSAKLDKKLKAEKEVAGIQSAPNMMNAQTNRLMAPSQIAHTEWDTGQGAQDRKEELAKISSAPGVMSAQANQQNADWAQSPEHFQQQLTLANLAAKPTEAYWASMTEGKQAHTALEKAQADRINNPPDPAMLTKSIQDWADKRYGGAKPATQTGAPQAQGLAQPASTLLGPAGAQSTSTLQGPGYYQAPTTDLKPAASDIGSDYQLSPADQALINKKKSLALPTS